MSMDYDAVLKESTDAVAPSAGGTADAASLPHPYYGPIVADIPVPDSRMFSLGSYAESSESSLIEEAWISERGARGCDHYLEHRLMAQDYEGLRMGRELHDSTGQLLLSLRLSIAHLRRAREGDEPDEIFEEINETVRQIDQEIRAFSFLHYPAELGKGGLIAALARLARGFGERTGLQIVFKAIGDQAIANRAASIALLRVAQEALMNVHRHAHAGVVRMSLVEREDRLELSVQDDGQGIPPPESRAVSNGVGLRGMRHRVERLGGHFSIRRLKHGTKLVASLGIGSKETA